MFIAVFGIFLLYLVFSSGWHIPSQLWIKGTTASNAELLLSWDSGAGFNAVESKEVNAGKRLATVEDRHWVTIKRTGEKNPMSNGTHVALKEIIADGKPIYILHMGHQKGVALEPGPTLYLEHDGAELIFDYKFTKSIQIRFVTIPIAGKVEITLDGDARTYDTYSTVPGNTVIVRRVQSHTPGDFSVILDLPRYDVDRLKIESYEGIGKLKIASAAIVSHQGRTDLPVNEEAFVSEVVFSDFKRPTKQYFHPVRFVFQALLAALLSGLVLYAVRFVEQHGGIRAVFLEERRPVFWVAFAGAGITFFLWLAAYWPGNLTTDSIDVWRIAKIPGGFLNKHPFLNIVYYRFLQQIWDHFAVVGVFQILVSAGLGSYIFYCLHKNGVTLIFLLPFYLLFLFSVPVGLYNITLWKDVPFALLVLFWAFYIPRLFWARCNGEPPPSRGKMALLAIAFVTLCLFRHNGIVYALIIPFLLMLLKILPVRKTLIAGTLTAVALLLLMTLVFPAIEQTDFLTHQGRLYLGRLTEMDPIVTTRRIYRTYGTVLDIEKHRDASDLWGKDSTSVQWHDNFTKRKGWNDWVRFYPHKPLSDSVFKFAEAVHRISYEIPWIYLSWNPFFLLWLFPLALVLFRLFPMSAIFSFVVLSQVLVLVAVVGSTNWRYYYFFLLSSLFLVPVALADLVRKGRLTSVFGWR